MTNEPDKPRKLFVRQTETDGAYWIEDNDGNSVCDFYYVDAVTKEMHQFDNAKTHAEAFVALWNDQHFW